MLISFAVVSYPLLVIIDITAVWCLQQGSQVTAWNHDVTTDRPTCQHTAHIVDSRLHPKPLSAAPVSHGTSTRTTAQLHTTATTHHTRLTASFPGQPGSAGTRNVQPVNEENDLNEERDNGEGSCISWTICKQSIHQQLISFYRPDALPDA